MNLLLKKVIALGALLIIAAGGLVGCSRSGKAGAVADGYVASGNIGTGEFYNGKYYLNGKSDDGLVLYGVAGSGNLFEPGKDIKVVIDCQNKSFHGKKAEINVASRRIEYNKNWSVELRQGKLSSIAFSSELNGLFTVKIKLPDNEQYSFNVAVMPKNKMASDDFYYGIQPYLSRSYTWGEGFWLPNCDGEKSIDLMLDAAEYMGVNLVREDNISWGGMQSKAYGPVDLKMQDFIINKINERGMKANIIFGFNADKWSAAKRFQDSYESSKGWTYMPDLDIWKDYATKVANHYKNNTNILWEIWNEPNWEPFFTGTKEEYFELLESTGKIFKSANPSTYVYMGGLAAAERESNLPYYQKAAQLIQSGVIDNYGYHNHDGYDTYYSRMQSMLDLTASAGLTGGINSESGMYGLDAGMLACKALYTRASGGDGFVSFAFRKSVTPENDINQYAYFNEYLQPTESVLSYSTVIRFLGNAKFEKSLSSSKNLQIDEYSASGKKILVYYSMGSPTKTQLPEGKYTAYDFVGNKVTFTDKITVGLNPIYFVFG